MMRTNCSKEVTALFEWGLSLEIEISVIGSDSSTNYPTRSKFKLRRRYWIGCSRSCHALHIHLRLDRHVSRSWAGQKVTTTDAPSAPFFLEEVGDFLSGGYRFSETPMERGEQNEMRTFYVWTQDVYCRFRFCPIVMCEAIQSGRTLNVRHIHCSAD